MLFIFISFGQPEKWHISITTRNLKENTVIGNGMYSAIGFPASCFCMALSFAAWNEGLERTKFFWMGPGIFTFAWAAFFFFEAKIASEEEKFRCGEQPLEALPYYRDRYWIRLRGILGLLGASFLGGGVFFTLGIP